MNPRLFLAGIYLPSGLQKRKLAELARLTARAFDTAPPRMEGLSLGEMRRLYAEFTRERAERALRSPAGPAAVRQRLFDEARLLGRDIARELRVSTRREVMAAARILYRGLEIDLEGDAGGEIIVRRCSFSLLYSPEVCRLMSGLDGGVLAGLAGGGQLEFNERLTEGGGCCRAHFTFPEPAR